MGGLHCPCQVSENELFGKGRIVVVVRRWGWEDYTAYVKLVKTPVWKREDYTAYTKWGGGGGENYTAHFKSVKTCCLEKGR